jgi:uncharacterized membrane protein
VKQSRGTRKEASNKMKHKIGMILLAIWLILTGLMQVISIPISAMIMAIIAIAAGVLILLGR